MGEPEVQLRCFIDFIKQDGTKIKRICAKKLFQFDQHFDGRLDLKIDVGLVTLNFTVQPYIMARNSGHVKRQYRTIKMKPIFEVQVSNADVEWAIQHLKDEGWKLEEQ